MLPIHIFQGTVLLFERPSFCRGFASLLDFRPNLAKYRTDKRGAAADARSLAADWQAVGYDITAALLTHGGKAR